jgi:mycobactin phenyloxazoline synthetase
VARAGLGVVVAETADAVPGMTCLAFDAACRHQPALESPVPVKPDDTAYILFTSGSTGEPKGVAVPHGAAMSTIEDLDQRLELGPGDRCLAVSALDFDLSVFDLFALLGAGGAVVLVGETDRREASAWLELAVDHEVTVLNCAPPLLDMVLGAADLTGTELADFRAVLLGGDWVTLDLPARLAKVAPTCRFLALGGTTETAIHSTLCEVVDPTGLPAGWHAVPYGRPLRNVACRVVDQRGRDCPDWVPGELWIGGAGVADGYVGDPVRTADRFVGRDGRRWYRTGDQARYWPDGTLDFLGRRDRQVKVRGFRIELGEVEAALASHPSVRRALAVVAGGEGSDATARHLVAAVAAPGATEEEILAHAAVLLPPQMLPGQVLVLDELPLTANGKLDRAAVVARAGTPLERSYDPPRTAVESVVAGVWSEVLGRDGGGPAGIGRDDDFFTLGGDSVLATAVVIRLRQALATGAVSVRALFSARTVAGLAARLVAEEENPGRLEQVAALSLEIDAMSADEVDAQLGSAPA